jgi:hypothetical protein
MSYGIKKSKPKAEKDFYNIQGKKLTIETTFAPIGGYSTPHGGKKDLRDLHYRIKEWGYVFTTKKDALRFAKTHVETNDGIVIEKKNPELMRKQ